MSESREHLGSSLRVADIIDPVVVFCHREHLVYECWLIVLAHLYPIEIPVLFIIDVLLLMLNTESGTSVI